MGESVLSNVVFVVVAMTTFGILAVPLAVSYRRKRRSLEGAEGRASGLAQR